MPTAMVTFNGRITLPSQVRRQLGLQTGDNVEFVEFEKGQFALKLMKGSIMELGGCIPRSDRAFTVEEMDEAVLETAAALDMATLSHSR